MTLVGYLWNNTKLRPMYGSRWHTAERTEVPDAQSVHYGIGRHSLIRKPRLWLLAESQRRKRNKKGTQVPFLLLNASRSGNGIGQAE